MRRPHLFEFKQFSIVQEHCAMKVCTDSCAFGALIQADNAHTILDIGTGSGLLALMLAQKTMDSVLIDAVEIDIQAIGDAHINIQQSPWHHRISLVHSSIQEYTQHHKMQYDMIVCNPPFYDKSTKPKTMQLSTALHADESLPYQDLLACISSLSHNDTVFWCMLPIEEMNVLIKLAEQYSLYPHQMIITHDTPQGPPIRIVCCFVKEKKEYSVQTFTYRETVFGPNTQEFSRVLQDYFLFLS